MRGSTETRPGTAASSTPPSDGPSPRCEWCAGGVGIPQDEIKNVLRRFVRGSHTPGPRAGHVHRTQDRNMRDPPVDRTWKSTGDRGAHVLAERHPVSCCMI